jgi:hypothetical protein
MKRSNVFKLAMALFVILGLLITTAAVSAEKGKGVEATIQGKVEKSDKGMPMIKTDDGQTFMILGISSRAWKMTPAAISKTDRAGAYGACRPRASMMRPVPTEPRERSGPSRKADTGPPRRQHPRSGSPARRDGNPSSASGEGQWCSRPRIHRRRWPASGRTGPGSRR